MMLRTTDHMSRRRFLTAAAACSLLPALPAAATTGPDLPAPMRENSVLDRLIPVIVPELNFINGNTKEELRTRFFRDDHYDPEAIRQLNWLMRDWRQADGPQIDVRLFWALAAIGNAAMKEGHSGQITFLSGYRTRKTNDYLRRQGYAAAENSYHLKARAVDFRLEGIPMDTVATYADYLEVGGLGRYRRSNFVHIDSGPVRSWSQ